MVVIAGEQNIQASRDVVWQALNDPDVLKQCIPGCQSLEKISDTEFSGKVKSKIGPVSATFAGGVTLSDLDPPNSYTLKGKGKGGAAGFASGEVKIMLKEDGEGTILVYNAEVKIGGKLAQLGSRLIDGTVTKMTGEFFSTFREITQGQSDDAPAEETAPEPTPSKSGVSPVAIGIGLVAVLALFYWVFAA